MPKAIPVPVRQMIFSSVEKARNGHCGRRGTDGVASHREASLSELRTTGRERDCALLRWLRDPSVVRHTAGTPRRGVSTAETTSDLGRAADPNQNAACSSASCVAIAAHTATLVRETGGAPCADRPTSGTGRGARRTAPRSLANGRRGENTACERPRHQLVANRGRVDRRGLGHQGVRSKQLCQRRNVDDPNPVAPHIFPLGTAGTLSRGQRNALGILWRSSHRLGPLADRFGDGHDCPANRKRTARWNDLKAWGRRGQSRGLADRRGNCNNASERWIISNARNILTAMGAAVGPCFPS